MVPEIKERLLCKLTPEPEEPEKTIRYGYFIDIKPQLARAMMNNETPTSKFINGDIQDNINYTIKFCGVLTYVCCTWRIY